MKRSKRRELVRTSREEVPPPMQAPMMAVPYLCLCLWAVLGGCSALSVRIDPRYRRSAYRSRISIQLDASTTTPIRDHFPASSRPSDIGGHSSMLLFGGEFISRNVWRRTQHVVSLSTDGDDDTAIHDKNVNDRKNFLHSIALVASCRRLSFLIISIAVMNFVRSTILKASRKSACFYCHTPYISPAYYSLTSTHFTTSCSYLLSYLTFRSPIATKRCSTNARGPSLYSTIRSNSLEMVHPMW